MILVVDFGSQTAHLIARRLKDLGAATRIVHPEEAIEAVEKEHPKGIILSGGPASVWEDNAPVIDQKIFSFGIPLLGICYGLQLMAKLLGGKVVSGKKEYGPARLKLKVKNYKLQITEDLKKETTVWMSHGDEVVEMPEGFVTLGSTEHVPFAFAADEKKKLYGLQFHPEVEHTEYGLQILQNFVFICHPELVSGSSNHSKEMLKPVQHDKDKIIKTISGTVGESFVIGAISGGVDSTVAGVIAARAIGKRFIPVYVDNGLMREGTREHVEKIFTAYDINPIVVNAEKEMLSRLQGITDPEQKRKIIGNFYIEIFEKEMEKIIKSGKNVKFLLQGTIYSDVIESKGTRHAASIKSHHNVGGLPKNMKMRLIEPLRELYKDEVRELGLALGLSDEFVYKQPFPGPGYAIRIRGEVTKERLEKEKIADSIVLEELGEADLLKKVFISFPVLTGAMSTAVKGDGRFFGEVVALRIVESKDVMTSVWSRIPYDVLQKISSRIVNEVPGISRVVYDITTKPPATMEWE